MNDGPFTTIPVEEYNLLQTVVRTGQQMEFFLDEFASDKERMTLCSVIANFRTALEAIHEYVIQREREKHGSS